MAVTRPPEITPRIIKNWGITDDKGKESFNKEREEVIWLINEYINSAPGEYQIRAEVERKKKGWENLVKRKTFSEGLFGLGADGIDNRRDWLANEATNILRIAYNKWKETEDNAFIAAFKTNAPNAGDWDAEADADILAWKITSPDSNSGTTGAEAATARKGGWNNTEIRIQVAGNSKLTMGDERTLIEKRILKRITQMRPELPPLKLFLVPLPPPLIQISWLIMIRT